MKIDSQFLYGLWLTKSANGAKSKETRPNVILILADDMGMGDISLYNKHGKTKTKNLDFLARNGLSFMDGHSASSRCGPSRYSLMTGR